MQEKVIYTIGHSTHDITTFVVMLQSFEIELLADIRNFPGSRRYPHFNSENLEKELADFNISYEHFKALGGRRKPRKDSHNNAWRVEAFRGYADYMETGDFQEAAKHLQQIAQKKRTAYMCSEAVWWSCHRSLLSDYLKIRGWKVMHIMKKDKADEHPYTKAATIKSGKLSYSKPDLFSDKAENA